MQKLSHFQVDSKKSNVLFILSGGNNQRNDAFSLGENSPVSNKISKWVTILVSRVFFPNVNNALCVLFAGG